MRRRCSDPTLPIYASAEPSFWIQARRSTFWSCRGNDGVYHDGYPLSVIDGQDVFIDGGVRDLFNWVVQGEQTMRPTSTRAIDRTSPT